jgi:hypothetical protein
MGVTKWVIRLRVDPQEGQGTDIARPGAPPTNPSTWGAPRIYDAILSVS